MVFWLSIEVIQLLEVIVEYAQFFATLALGTDDPKKNQKRFFAFEKQDFEHTVFDVYCGEDHEKNAKLFFSNVKSPNW